MVVQSRQGDFINRLRSGLSTTEALNTIASEIADPSAAEDPSWLKRLKAREPSCYFLVGSCRYPGTPFDNNGADRAFDGMLALLASNAECDLLFLIGDQIYADATSGVLDPTPWRDRYVDRYRSAFKSPAVAAVLSSLPVHFAIDDHEFVDNYAGYSEDAVPWDSRRDRSGEEIGALKAGSMSQEQFEFAKKVANAYMGSARDAAPFGNSSALSDRFWYALDDGAEISCPAFILDTRSERRRADADSPARLMADDQMAAFKAWLSAKKADGRPKFVFLGSPIVPLVRESEQPGFWMRQDGPTGYPIELAAIVKHIVAEQVQRVVFVGGDPHLSCVARMQLSDGQRTVEALHVISSGLYAPLPFANLAPSAADWSNDAPMPGKIVLPDGAQIVYEQDLLIAGPPHFLRVSAVPANNAWTIGIQVYGNDATVLRERNLTL
jgi:cholesterol oxidase